MTLFFISIIALVFGSFASCVTYRLAHNQSFVLTRSKCPKCKNNLRAKNLIPLFSWLWQKGKCDNCHHKISWRYPLIEIFFLITFLTIYFLNHNHLSQKFILLCAIATILIIIAIVDIEKYFIPDLMQIALFIFAVIYVITEIGFPSIGKSFFSGILYAGFGFSLYLLFYYVSNISAIGVDDIKILFTIGFILGLEKFLPFIFLTGIFGIIFGVLWTKIKRDETFPFAPTLCLSMFFCLMLERDFSVVDSFISMLF